MRKKSEWGKNFISISVDRTINNKNQNLNMEFIFLGKKIFK